MGLKKAFGILVLSTQSVIGADYYIQTRDAGLRWGDLSTNDYRAIIQHRFARARTAKVRAVQAGEPASAWRSFAEPGGSIAAAPGGPRQMAGAGTAAAPDGPPPVCIRRGNVANC
jgi:hypothetical protein